MPVKLNYDYFKNTARQQYGATRLPTTIVMVPPTASGEVLAFHSRSDARRSAFLEAQRGCRPTAARRAAGAYAQIPGEPSSWFAP